MYNLNTKFKMIKECLSNIDSVPLYNDDSVPLYNDDNDSRLHNKYGDYSLNKVKFKQYETLYEIHGINNGSYHFYDTIQELFFENIRALCYWKGYISIVLPGKEFKITEKEINSYKGMISILKENI